MIQAVCSLAFFTLMTWAVVVGRRRQRLRNAGVGPRGALAEEWSPEAISAVLSALDPALVGVRSGDANPYERSAELIFEELPQRDVLDREAFEALVASSLEIVSAGLATARETRRAADRLWQMHAAAHARWERE
ncbi:MAG: hypothetical protein P4L93_04035 [Coriobacteriia bacterium]|nr:hypothetical protein [Coriobacteriia bacterium]